MSPLLDPVSAMGIRDNHTEVPMGPLDRHVERRVFTAQTDRSVVALD